jgi:RNA polymerase sigma-70 factor (ECF subfamily)
MSTDDASDIAGLNEPDGLGQRPAGRVVNVFVLEVADGLVQAVRSVVNPDKLGHLGPVSDVARLAENPPAEE